MQNPCSSGKLTKSRNGLASLNGANGRMSGCIKLSRSTWPNDPMKELTMAHRQLIRGEAARPAPILNNPIPMKPQSSPATAAPGKV